MLTNLFSQSTLELKESATNEGKFRQENGLEREQKGTTWVHFMNGSRPSKLELKEVDTLHHIGTKQIQFILPEDYEKARKKLGADYFLKESFHDATAAWIREFSTAHITWDSLQPLWDLVDAENAKTLAYVENLKTDPDNTKGLKFGTEQGGYFYINGDDYPCEVKFWTCPDAPKGDTEEWCGCNKEEGTLDELPKRYIPDKIRNDLGPDFTILGWWHTHPSFYSSSTTLKSAGDRRSSANVWGPSGDRGDSGDRVYFRDYSVNRTDELNRLPGGPALIIHEYGVTIFRGDGLYPGDKVGVGFDDGYREIKK